MKPAHFIEALGGIKFENTFNPYTDRCPVHDKNDAPRRRSDSLLAMMERANQCEIDSLWIGRDLGYRGGRRTGFALTDDANLPAHAERWGIFIEKPTKGEVVAERTAAIIWSMLHKIDVTIFLWNVFPLHPHEANDPFTNRAHNSRERCAGEDLLHQLIILLRPKKFVAIGNDAASTARRLAGDQGVIKIRHPSYGGQTQFMKQIKDFYGLNDMTSRQDIYPFNN